MRWISPIRKRSRSSFTLCLCMTSERCSIIPQTNVALLEPVMQWLRLIVVGRKDSSDTSVRPQPRKRHHCITTIL